jgi:hypothetical protein
MIPGSDILKVLVEECGWNPSDTDILIFRHHYDQADPRPLEYRFMGALGFGGKLHAQADRLSVSCYQEDETPERCAMIQAANARLADLVVTYRDEEVRGS